MTAYQSDVLKWIVVPYCFQCVLASLTFLVKVHHCIHYSTLVTQANLHNIMLYHYIDNWLIEGSSKILLLNSLCTTLNPLNKVRFRIEKKYLLYPIQIIDFIDAHLNFRNAKLH